MSINLLYNKLDKKEIHAELMWSERPVRLNSSQISVYLLGGKVYLMYNKQR